MTHMCKKCGVELCRDEIAVYMRMVDRRAKEFLCKPCLAGFYGCSVEVIDKKINQFKKNGCVLFQLDDPSAADFEKNGLPAVN